MGSKTTPVNTMRDQVVEKATIDMAFRERLLADPTAAIKDELGVTIPKGFTIEVHEDVATTSHLVLPPFAELEEADLKQASGGRPPRYLWELGV